MVDRQVKNSKDNSLKLVVLILRFVIYREMTDSPKHVPTSPPSDTNLLDTIITSTNSVSTRLKTLEKEHQSLLSELPQDKVYNEETANDFECLLVQEKQRVQSESMKKLHYGLNEAKVSVCNLLW